MCSPSPSASPGPNRGDSAESAAPTDLADLIRRHQASVWRHLRWLGCSPSEADDLTQDVFLVLLEAPFEHRSPSETASFLRTTAKHHWRDHRRGLKRVGGTDDDQVWVEAATEAFLAHEAKRSDRVDALRACLGRVDGRARDALTLYYQERQSQHEVGRAIGLGAGGVKILLQTRKALRDCVERTLGGAL